MLANQHFLEFLLWFQTAKRTGRFYIGHGDEAAEIYMLEGFIIHTQSSQEIGLEALLRILLDWDEPKVVAWEMNLMPEYQTSWLDAASTLILLTRYMPQDQRASDGSPFHDRDLGPSEKEKQYVITFHVESESAGSFSKEIDQDQFHVGRDEHNELAINDGTLSRQHCFISRKGNKLYLHDLNSSNGTFVDDQPIIFSEAVEGHTIKFGGASCMFTVKEKGAGLQLDYEKVMKTSLIPKGLLNNTRKKYGEPTVPATAAPAPESSDASATPTPKPRKTRPLGMGPIPTAAPATNGHSG